MTGGILGGARHSLRQVALSTSMRSASCPAGDRGLADQVGAFDMRQKRMDDVERPFLRPATGDPVYFVVAGKCFRCRFRVCRCH